MMRKPLIDRFRTILAIVLAIVLVMQAVPARAMANEIKGTPGVVVSLIDACLGLFGLSTGTDEAASLLTETSFPDVVEFSSSEKIGANASRADASFETVSNPGDQASTPVVETVNDTAVEAKDPVLVSSAAPDSVVVEPVGPKANLEKSSLDAGTLTSSFISADGHSFVVSMDFTSDAKIPVGSYLVVTEIVNGMDETNVSSQVEATLGLGADDCILDTRLLDVSIEADGQTVVPAASVALAIESDAVDSSRSSFIEVVCLENANAASPNTAEVVECSVNPIEAHSNTSKASGVGLYAGQTAETSSTKICFNTTHLGTFALASVAARTQIQEISGLEVWLLAPRKERPVSVLPTPAPQLEEGLDVLGCFAVETSGVLPNNATLLIEATPSAAGVVTDYDNKGIACHIVDERGVVSEDALFESDGTEKPLAIDCVNERLLFVRDTGYRKATIRSNDVTVTGLMPEDVEGVVRDVTADYDEVPLAPQVRTSGLKVQEEHSVAGLSTIAAYDITLTSKGREYQPEEEHPLTVTLENPAFRVGCDLEVLHIADDGSVERVEDFEHTADRVTFIATGFSTYLVAREDGAIPDGRSTTFILYARANRYMRESTVSFVDTEGNPILSTVTNNQEIVYTGGGTASNKTNTIDLYDFVDRIDPEIQDEYEFRRVYMTRAANNEKEIRFVQVGDGTAVGQDASILYAFFNMNGIAENANGQPYSDMWYNIAFNGNMDDVYIEYYHVAPTSFRSIDTRNDPVEGAKFVLYTDAECNVPLKYKDEEVEAVSDADGQVTFGKIPRGTYYMKETVFPKGYRRSTNVYEVIVDGKTPIQDVVHEDDDGSIIIADALRMSITKEWKDGEGSHANDSVIVTVFAHDDDVNEVELNAENGWTQTLDDLDPNLTYMVSETSVRSNGETVTSDWIAEIDEKVLNHSEGYFKTEGFKEGEQYVILTTTSSGTRALVGNTSLATTPLVADKNQITGEVTDDMLWSADTVTPDGMVVLQNVASGKYLDQESQWFLNDAYPASPYIQYTNEDGKAKFSHRANLNTADTCYLYVNYGPEYEGQVTRYMNNESKGANFELFRKVDVRAVDATILNMPTRYPIAIRSVNYPDGAALSDVTFNLYREENYDEAGTGEPLMAGLRSNDNGYLVDGGGKVLHEMSAGIYYLCRMSSLEDEGYCPLDPIKFTITRGGALRVAQEDQEVHGFAYVLQDTFEGVSCPVLQVPNRKGVTLEISLAIEGTFADLTREFAFELAMPEGVDEIEGTVNGAAVTFTSENNTFTLANGQTVSFNEIPSRVAYVLTQTSDRVAARPTEGDGLYAATVSVESGDKTVMVTQSETDARIVTLTNLMGSVDVPVRVKITNTLSGFSAPATGLHDNVSVWLVVVVVSLVALGAVMYGNRSRCRD